MNKKGIIFILIIIIIIFILIIPNLTNFYSNNEFIVTESGTVINTPNGVKLINTNNNIEIYGNDIAKFIIINNNDTNLINNLESAFTSGEYLYDGIYKHNLQTLDNNFNIWTGETLALKENTVYTTYTKNNKTNEYIFCISESQSICDVKNWNIDWDK